MLKCDESRPACLNCVNTEFSCSYRSATSTTLMVTETSAQQTVPAHSPLGDLPTVSGIEIVEALPISSPADVAFSQSSSQNGVNMLHLELLHHMSSVTWKGFGPNGSQAKVTFDAAVNIALGAPFLMHQLLAVSALHLSTLRLAKRDYYSSEATRLQTEALTLFNNLNPEWMSENTVPVLLFSSLLGIHVLFDTLLFRPADFSVFIDRFVDYLRLHRGVHAVVKGSWSILLESEIAPMLRTRSVVESQNIGNNECGPLKLLIDSSNLSEQAIGTCVQAIDRLQWVFDSFHIRNESSEDDMEVDLIFAWPSTVSLEYTELLLQKRPEALAILAHYAVLLHWRRSLWVIKDGGIFLIEAIMRYLGSYWEHWLAYPASQILDSSTHNG